MNVLMHAGSGSSAALTTTVEFTGTLSRAKKNENECLPDQSVTDTALAVNNTSSSAKCALHLIGRPARICVWTHVIPICDVMCVCVCVASEWHGLHACARARARAHQQQALNYYGYYTCVVLHICASCASLSPSSHTASPVCTIYVLLLRRCTTRCCMYVLEG